MEIIKAKDLLVTINPSFGGRIQQIYFKDTPLLYEPTIKLGDNAWINYGGDFLWLAPQHKWGGWPPIKEFDKIPWEVQNLSNKIILKSKSWNGIVLSREIYFDNGELIVENHLLNQSNSDVEWGLWNISQLSLVDLEVSFNVSKLKVFDYPENITENMLFDSGDLVKENNDYFVFPKKSFDFKIGGISNDGTLTCRFGEIVLVKQIIQTEKHQQTEYPHNCNIEIYKNNEYLEAELVWPLVKVHSGKKTFGIQKFIVKKG